MEYLNIPADTKELGTVTHLVESFLLQNGFSPKCVMQTQIAAEEIFTNICRHAHLPKTATVEISICMEGEAQAVIRFADCGAAFDPLAQKAPDPMLPAEKRKEGGLGIYLVRNLVSDITYQYKNGMNILTIVKQKNAEES